MTREEHGTTFFVSRETQKFFIPVLGEHNAHNAMAAIAVGRYFNLSNETIAQGLAGLKLTNMRMELVKAESGLTFINDAYNASPTSMKAAIKLIHEIQGYNKKILVLGICSNLVIKKYNFIKRLENLLTLLQWNMYLHTVH